MQWFMAHVKKGSMFFICLSQAKGDRIPTTQSGSAKKPADKKQVDKKQVDKKQADRKPAVKKPAEKKPAEKKPTEKKQVEKKDKPGMCGYAKL